MADEHTNFYKIINALLDIGFIKGEDGKNIKITYGTTMPSSSEGEVGDIFVLTNE